MKDFRTLTVWQEAHGLTLAIYEASRRFPKEELYGLTSQMRRCSASIAANIAEGCGRQGDGELQRFLGIAAGSASELDYHLILAKDLGLLAQSEYKRLAGSLVVLRRRLSAFINKVSGDRDSANS